MTLRSLLFGEQARIRAAGLFSTRRQAVAAARRLRDLGAESPELVGPPDDKPALLRRKCGGTVASDWRCLVRIHLAGAVGGAVLGVQVFVWLTLTRHAAAGASALLALTTFNALIGAVAAGVAGLRPDHMRVVAAVRRAIRRGRWAVVVHAVGERQADVLLSALEERSYRVVRSL